MCSNNTKYYITRYILKENTPLIYKKKTYEIKFEKKHVGDIPYYKEIPVDTEIISEGFPSYLCPLNVKINSWISQHGSITPWPVASFNHRLGFIHY